MHIADEIAKLAKLKQEGAISEAEFLTLKQRLVSGQLSPAQPATAFGGDGRPVQIELTSKALKKQVAYGVIMIVAGFFLAVGNAVAGNRSVVSLCGLLSFVGVVWTGVASVRVWWHHR